MEYRLTYTITQKDFMDFNTMHTFHGKNGIILFLSLMLIIIASFLNNSFSLSGSLIFIASLIAVYALTFILLFTLGSI